MKYFVCPDGQPLEFGLDAIVGVGKYGKAVDGG
jgi:hypothetical protein